MAESLQQSAQAQYTTTDNLAKTQTLQMFTLEASAAWLVSCHFNIPVL